MHQSVATGELDAAKSIAANLVAQLRVETADKQQLSTKLADSEPPRLSQKARRPLAAANAELGPQAF